MGLSNIFRRKKEENPEKIEEEPAKTEEELRKEKSREVIEREKKERLEREEKTAEIIDNARDYFEGISKETGVPALEIANKVFENDVMLIEFSETDGKASLVYKSWQSTLPALGETQELSAEIIRQFRELRRNFAPISAGVEWHRDFTSGGGFTVQVDDPKDKHKKDMQDGIKAFCANVYQDQYTMGLDKIMDVEMDIALTDGCAAAEIVYDVEVDFMDYVEGFEPVEVIDKDGKKITVQIMIPKEPDWKGKLKRITRLKIINDAYNRLRPYRHPKSGEILFWTLDEKAKQEWATRETIKKDCIKFHPWEIFWLSWNQTGTNLKGDSIIRPVYSVAKFVNAIQNAVGVGFNRWANKKYFFVCGDIKRPWSKEAQKSFLKAMAQMIKHNYVGIPVPPAFDIKNIGGEGTVFEGKNLLDYLTGQICTGMQFPRDFLETGKTQASDKSWLAWTVRYGRNQQQVRRAIEQQLWKRHLWCLHGKVYRVGKKGVERKDQERRDIYVPKLQWRAEGRWHREKKVELFKSLLDAANPIDPPLKMAVQKGIADVLGFGAIDWNTIIDLFEIKGETRLLESKLAKLEAEAKLKIAEELGVEGLVKKLEEQEKAKAQMAKQPAVKVPTEEELERRAEARLEGGVSRTPKGQAKPMGGTREPKRIAESFLPKEVAEQIAKNIIKTEKEKQKKIIAETKRFESEVKTLNVEAEQRKNVMFEESEERKKTEELRQQKLRLEIAKRNMEVLEEHGLLSKEKADELAESMLETQRKDQERINVETAKAKAEFERQKKKIELLDELEERMKKKKKTIKREESEPLPFVNTGKPLQVKEKPKPSEPQKVKLDINVKSEPVKAEVDVNVKTPKEIEETKARNNAELELIKKRNQLVDKQKEILEKEEEEKKNEKEAKKKLRERKRKVLEKIEKKVEEDE